jgi:DNA-binding response OmpR family regulator
MKILIIEDEFNLADAIKTLLIKEKYAVDIETDGEEGLYCALSNTYDLIILDVMLPSINGFEILKEIKKNNIDAKILMLTAKTTIDDKMVGFNSGADDYLTKPFHMEELLARINVQLRKNNFKNNNIISLSDLNLNIKNSNLSNSITNLNVNVIGKELYLLELFMKNPNQILDKELIFNKVWGFDTETEINTLEAYISFIRRKLKLIKSNVQIKAIRNMGYKMEVLNEKTKD